MDTEIPISGDFIRLDNLLKIAGVTDSGGQAKILIQDGYVKLNGEVTTQRGRKIRPGDVVEMDEPSTRIVVATPPLD